jgi:hypothetical protein
MFQRPEFASRYSAPVDVVDVGALAMREHHGAALATEGRSVKP